MTSPVVRFYSSIKNAASLSDAAKINFFVYYLTEVADATHATVKTVEGCFRECDLAVPKSIAPHLSRGLSSQPKKFIAAGSGSYRLERHHKGELAEQLGGETHTVEIPKELRNLEEQLPAGAGREWLKEALDCFGVEAYRATLVMLWLFALDHLFHHILSFKLAEFNAAMASHPDQKAIRKVGTVSARDDFTPLGEELFLDLCRNANIISPDVRRVMGGALGTRNSAAHPSGVTITRNKVAVIAEDLVLNVALKYPR